MPKTTLGRVVYNRATHYFSQRDSDRIQMAVAATAELEPLIRGNHAAFWEFLANAFLGKSDWFNWIDLQTELLGQVFLSPSYQVSPRGFGGGGATGGWDTAPWPPSEEVLRYAVRKLRYEADIIEDLGGFSDG